MNELAAQTIKRPIRGLLPRYGSAVILVGVGLLARWSLDPVLHDRAPLITMPYAVFLAAYFGGVGPGILATLLADVVAAYWFMYPRNSFRVIGLPDQMVLISFLLLGMLISFLTERSRRFREQALAAELALAESRYLALVHQSPEPILVLEETDKIQVINVRASDRFSPQAPSRLLGASFLELIDVRDRELVRQWLSVVRPGAAQSPAPVRLQPAGDGSVFEADLVAELLPGLRPRIQVTLRQPTSGTEAASNDGLAAAAC